MTGTAASASGPVTETRAVLAGIWVAPRGGAPMQAVASAQLEPGVGIVGDRYGTGRGHWSGQGDCEVTLIDCADLDALATEGVDLRAGRHRRNLETTGVRLDQLAGKRFAIGSAELVFERVRPPCRYLESLTQTPRLRELLAGGRGGICARVLTPGRVRTGDPIVVRDG